MDQAANSKKRCSWARNNQLEADYHDLEWGRPKHDDKELFEMVCLEGAQAGLSWLTILKKREGYRLAFANFDPAIVALFTDDNIEQLRQNPDIVRNRLKIKSCIQNAQAFLRLQAQHGSFDTYIWNFVDGKPLRHAEQQRAETTSVEMSKQLRSAGFNFVGPTICFALMQSIGMINDHTSECYLYQS